MRTAQELIALIENDKITELTTSDFKINFTSQELKEFVHFCIVSKSLESVEIKNIEFNPVIEDLLGRVLPMNNSIKKLELNNLRSFDKAGGSLKELLQFNTGIEELVISNNSNIDGVLAYIFPDLKDNSQIKKFNLTSNSLNNETIGLIANLLETNESLNEIDLSHQPLAGNSLASLFEAIGKNQNITAIKLSNTHLTTNSFDLLSSKLLDNKSLLNLDLSFNSFKDSLPLSFFQFLKGENNLSKLNLQNCDLNRYFASNLARTFSEKSKFSSINLSQNNLCDLGITIISRYAKNIKSLLNLDLRNNNATLLASYMAKETLGGLLDYQI